MKAKGKRQNACKMTLTQTTMTSPRRVRPGERGLVETLLAWTGMTKATILYDSDLCRETRPVLHEKNTVSLMITRTGAVYGLFCPYSLTSSPLVCSSESPVFLFCTRQETGTEPVMLPQRWLLSSLFDGMVCIEDISPPRSDEPPQGSKTGTHPVLRVSLVDDPEWIPDDEIPNLVLRGPTHEEDPEVRRTAIGQDVKNVWCLFEGIKDTHLIVPSLDDNEELWEADPLRFLCIQLE